MSEKTNLGIRVKAVVLLLLLAGMLGFVIAWRWSSFNDWLNVDNLVFTLRRSGADLGVIYALSAVALASIIAIPLGIIIVVSSVTFGPWLGVCYAMGGAAIGGMLSYGAGSFLGHDALCRFAGQRANALSRRLAERGFLAVVIIRMVPIAPFAIVNMIAGATHIRFRDFVIGTLLGMLPGALAIAVFVDQIEALLRAPNFLAAIILVGILCLLALGVWFGRRWMVRLR